MKEFGPVRPASEAADFGIVDLVSTKGWLVTGHGYGMYTYVHPQELSSNPHDIWFWFWPLHIFSLCKYNMWNPFDRLRCNYTFD